MNFIITSTSICTSESSFLFSAISSCKSLRLYFHLILCRTAVGPDNATASTSTTSRRLADRKAERFDKNIMKRGAVPETTAKKGKDYPVGPVLHYDGGNSKIGCTANAYNLLSLPSLLLSA
uniref:Uncharacterized protein n=1 Tax=Quercus lobata TaxID=97700 RepID=A0A7N2R460_QUELO